MQWVRLWVVLTSKRLMVNVNFGTIKILMQDTDIQYNTTDPWYCRSSFKLRGAHTHLCGADAVVLQSNCVRRTCSRSLHSNCLGWGLNPYSPCKRRLQAECFNQYHIRLNTRYPNKIQIPNTDIRHWYQMLIQDAGTRYILKILIQDISTRYWYKTLIQDTDTRIWYKILI